MRRSRLRCQVYACEAVAEISPRSLQKQGTSGPAPRAAESSHSMSLLDKAMQFKYKSKTTAVITNEEIELAIAWVRGQVTTRQLGHAIGLKSSGSASYSWTATRLREAFARKMLP